MTREEAKNYIKTEWRTSNGTRISTMLKRYFSAYKRDIEDSTKPTPLLTILNGEVDIRN